MSNTFWILYDLLLVCQNKYKVRLLQRQQNKSMAAKFQWQALQFWLVACKRKTSSLVMKTSMFKDKQNTDQLQTRENLWSVLSLPTPFLNINFENVVCNYPRIHAYKRKRGTTPTPTPTPPQKKKKENHTWLCIKL